MNEAKVTMTGEEFDRRQAHTHCSGQVAASNGIATLADQWAATRFIAGRDEEARQFRAFAAEIRYAYKEERERLQKFIDEATQ